jgi:hypothetical protein
MVMSDRIGDARGHLVQVGTPHQIYTARATSSSRVHGRRNVIDVVADANGRSSPKPGQRLTASPPLSFEGHLVIGQDPCGF